MTSQTDNWRQLNWDREQLVMDLNEIGDMYRDEPHILRERRKMYDRRLARFDEQYPVMDSHFS